MPDIRNGVESDLGRAATSDKKQTFADLIGGGNSVIGRFNLYRLMALLGVGSAALAAKGPLNVSLCAADERVYFSCQADKSVKRIALCGQVKGSPGDVRGFLQYRFGTREHAEMVTRALGTKRWKSGPIVVQDDRLTACGFYP
jgi:hypothetical protein